MGSLSGEYDAAKASETERTYARISTAVETSGFVHAWATHFADIVRLHNDGQFPGGLLGPNMHALMMKDPRVREHVTGLSLQDDQPIGQPPGVEEPTPGGLIPLTHRGFTRALRDLFRRDAEDFPDVREGDGRPVRYLSRAVFQNWGRTVENTPALTFVPETKTGVRNVVKWVAAHGKGVRAAGYRHTWSDLYSADDQVLVSLLPLDVVEDLPAPEPAIDPADQLQGIQIVGTIEEGGVTRARCKIGAATTNEQFRRWCLDDQGGKWEWTVPLNVIMVEITWGGSNAPICHGAGWRNQTLSDLVAEIEFVNARGELQTVSDPEQLAAAAGCFGLLGIVTSLTLKLDPMSYATMRPTKPRLPLAIPPPIDFKVPDCIEMSGITEQDLERAWADFVDRCQGDYYSEWFWFPYQQRAWVNTWKNDGTREQATRYPSELETFVEQAEEYLGQLLNTSLFTLLPGRLQAELLGVAAMTALPEDTAIVTPLIEALHFRRGIQNMRVLDMELEIPIPPRADDPSQPDWTVCQKAWWSVVSNVCNRDDAPMRIALEMRITADSRVIMAPQFGNQFGTCSIEILTTPNVAPEDWLVFMQEIADVWDSYTDPGGSKLNVRPHWAKEWQGLRFRGMPVREYLKTIAYEERIPEFKLQLQAIASAGGYTLMDQQRMFSNPLLNDLFENVFHEPG